jgi:1-acyl-sn-glycerol-3-phosphate acyltransferase
LSGEAEASADGRAAAEVLVHCTPVYKAGRALTRFGWRLWFRPRLEARHLLPATGGALICANHQSFLDIPLVSHLTPRHVSFVARASLAKSSLLGWVMRESGAVLIQPGKPDRAALRQMVAHLEAGDLVAIFPEGSRTWDGSLGELRAGALVAARQANVPVVPIGIRGAFEAWPRQVRLPRPRRVAARVGAPLDADAPDALEQLRASLAALVGDGRFDSLPPIP